jgi:hypothetical protein
VFYVYNKIDVVGIDDVDNLARQPNSLVISCNLKVCFICVFRQFDPMFVCVIPKNYIVILAALNCSAHHQVLWCPKMFLFPVFISSCD